MPLHDFYEPGFGVVEMALQGCSAWFKFSGGEQLKDFSVNRNQRARIVVTSIHQNHSYSQFAQNVLVKGIQPLVAVKANQEAVKM